MSHSPIAPRPCESVGADDTRCVLGAGHSGEHSGTHRTGCTTTWEGVGKSRPVSPEAAPPRATDRERANELARHTASKRRIQKLGADLAPLAAHPATTPEPTTDALEYRQGGYVVTYTDDADRMPKLNGVELGEHSPYLTKRGAKRYVGPSEHDIQSAYIEAIGYKRSSVPDLDTLYAIPNGASASSKAAAGRRKAEGQLASIPDVHWPVARGPFIGLWIEFKIPGKYPTAEQRAMHDRLRAQGHCVVISRDVQHAVDLTLRYDRLGHNRPSVRHASGWVKGTPLGEVVAQWRDSAALHVMGA